MMDNFKHLCPVCKAKGNTSFLQLRQINLSTAVYLCKDIRCEYPLGHSWIYEDRKLSDSDDDSDSDLSDIVNNDIEKMNVFTNSFNLKACNVDNHIINKMITQHASSASCGTKNKHQYESLKFKDNISHNINQNSVITPCKEVDDINCTSNVDDVQSDIHKSTSCDEVMIIESAQEAENIIIDDPNELFSSLDLPCDINTTNENYKILATGAENTELVDVVVSETITPSDTQVEYEIVKNQKDPNTFVIDIRMPNIIQDNKARENEKETTDINIPVTKKNAKNKFVILNAKTGSINKLNEVQKVNANEANIINLSDSICKEKPNTLQRINSNEILDITQSKQIKNMEDVSKNNVLPTKKKTDTSVTKNLETSDNIVSGKNIETSTGKTTMRDENEDLVLPFAKDANIEFKSLYSSKLKLHAKKIKPKFNFPESVLEDAFKTLQEHVGSDSKKKNSVQIISGRNRTKMTKNKSASSFEGFKFSSKIVKQASPKNKHVDSLDQLELRNFLQTKKSKKRKKEKRKCESDDDVDFLNTDSSNTSGFSVSSEENVQDKTNLGMGDLTLNELFDNINDLSAVNVPNSSANITEVDEWLNSLCE